MYFQKLKIFALLLGFGFCFEALIAEPLRVESTRRRSKLPPLSPLNLTGQQDQLALAVAKLLRHQYLLPNFIEITAGKLRKHSQGAASQDIYFAHADIPLCEFQLKAISYGDGPPVIYGQAPGSNASFAAFDQDAWSEIQQMVLQAAEKLNFAAAQVNVAISKPCYMAGDHSYNTAFRGIVLIDDKPYAFLGSLESEVILTQAFFSVSGQASAYKRSPKHDAAPEAVALKNLVGNGYLTNDFFTTYVDKSDRVFSADHVFDDAPPSGEFDEISLFAHANKHLDWFRSLGYDETREQLFKLEPNVIFIVNDKEVIDNAQYYPDYSAGTAQIKLGWGSCTPTSPLQASPSTCGLRNLTWDGDVVSHEFGHHVVFRSVKETSGTSMVIHEALADAFTMMRNNDPCFAGAVCPANDASRQIDFQSCEIAGQCLRSANNDMTFRDKDLPGAGHLQSQVISGMLWDLQEDKVLTLSELANLTYGSIDFLLAKSTFKDFVLALVSADDILFSGAHSCQIFDYAVGRGLIEKSDDECGEDNQYPTPQVETEDESEKLEEDRQVPIDKDSDISVDSSSSSRSGGKGSTFGCSVASQSATSFPGGLLLFFLPLLVNFLRFRIRSIR